MERSKINEIFYGDYTSLKDINEKVICSQDLYNKMNKKQISYINVAQNPVKPNEVHVRANSWFYAGFARVKATNSIIRYSVLSRKFKIIDSKLVPLKEIYKDFALTWFRQFETKNAYSLWFTAYWFYDEIFGDSCIICQQYHEEYLNI